MIWYVKSKVLEVSFLADVSLMFVRCNTWISIISLHTIDLELMKFLSV